MWSFVLIKVEKLGDYSSTILRIRAIQGLFTHHSILVHPLGTWDPNTVSSVEGEAPPFRPCSQCSF